MLTLLLSAVLIGCPGDDGSVQPPTDGVAVPIEASKPKEGLAGAKDTFAAGDPAAALKLAEAWLATHPTDDATWDFVELAAIRSGEAGALVDRLSADQAIGGRADRHHALRGAMAIAASRPADALVAAAALATAAPGDSAALIAQAVALGAPVPAGIDAATAALLAAQSDATAAIDPLVESLPGWRVALERAKLKHARADLSGANAELAKLPAGLPRLAGLPLLLLVAPDDASAWAASDTAAREALAVGDAEGAAQALELGLPAAYRGWKAEAAAAAAAEMRKALTEAKNTEGAAALAVIQADASIRAGMPGAAREAATFAASSTRSKAKAAWQLAVAGAALGDAASIDAQISSLKEPEATAARELAAVLRGGSHIPGLGLDTERSAHLALLSAGWLDDASDAIRVALSSTSPDLRTWATAWSAEGFPADATGGARSEASARAFLTGNSSLPVEGDHPDTAAWNAVIRNDPAQQGGGVTAWARARIALAATDAASAAREYGTLALAAPAWRTGPWRPILTLDGPPPELLVADSELIRTSVDPFTPAVAVHGWSHRRTAQEALWHAGSSPIPVTATPEQSAAAWDAAARYRYLSLQWLSGGAAFPTAARDALSAAEKAAGLTAFQSPNVTALRGALDSTAIISFRPLAGAVEVLYVTPDGGKLRMLKPQTGEAIWAWQRSVSAGEAGVTAGDKLREAVFDGALEVLTGIGKFLVVGPPPYGTFAINALPEQRDGLRFLADIRSVSVYPDFDSVAEAPPKPNEEFQQTLVALCANPVEADTIRRIYPSAMVLEGPQATAAAWQANAGGSRFLHIGDFPAGPSGGWQLADGELTVGAFASTPLVARGAYVGGGSDPDVAYARLVAAHRAGLRDFLVGAAGPDPTFHERVQRQFWEGMNRRYTSSRSFYDARLVAVKDGGDIAKRPGNWVRYLIYGRP